MIVYCLQDGAANWCVPAPAPAAGHDPAAAVQAVALGHRGGPANLVEGRSGVSSAPGSSGGVGDGGCLAFSTHTLQAPIGSMHNADSQQLQASSSVCQGATTSGPHKKDSRSSDAMLLVQGDEMFVIPEPRQHHSAIIDESDQQMVPLLKRRRGIAEGTSVVSGSVEDHLLCASGSALSHAPLDSDRAASSELGPLSACGLLEGSVTIPTAGVNVASVATSLPAPPILRRLRKKSSREDALPPRAVVEPALPSRAADDVSMVPRIVASNLLKRRRGGQQQ